MPGDKRFFSAAPALIKSISASTCSEDAEAQELSQQTFSSLSNSPSMLSQIQCKDSFLRRISGLERSSTVNRRDFRKEYGRVRIFLHKLPFLIVLKDVFGSYGMRFCFSSFPPLLSLFLAISHGVGPKMYCQTRRSWKARVRWRISMRRPICQNTGPSMSRRHLGMQNGPKVLNL